MPPQGCRSRAEEGDGVGGSGKGPGQSPRGKQSGCSLPSSKHPPAHSIAAGINTRFLPLISFREGLAEVGGGVETKISGKKNSFPATEEKDKVRAH